MKHSPIPVNTPLLDGNEEKYLIECIRSGWISSDGPFVSAFETKFSTYCERQHGIAVANGSAALDIAVSALGIGPGDEVIMPTFTIISPAQSIVKAGAIPVLVDSDPITWNMDVTQIESKITRKTKAILVVHMYGLPAEMDGIVHLAKKHNLLIIEDAAEMHGQTYKNNKCGSFGDISVFSFYPNKLITTGEGGMLLTNDSDLAEKCRKLRNLAFEPNGPRFVHEELGWNYRMTNMQAALGLAQLEQIEAFIIKKREVGTFYQQALAPLREKNYLLPNVSTRYASNIYWVFGLVAPSESEKVLVVQKLAEDGIATRPFFWCIHEQPVFKKMGLFENLSFPTAEMLARNGFYIPTGLGIRHDQMERVADTLLSIT